MKMKLNTFSDPLTFHLSSPGDHIMLYLVKSPLSIGTKFGSGTHDS